MPSQTAAAQGTATGGGKSFSVLVPSAESVALSKAMLLDQTDVNQRAQGT